MIYCGFIIAQGKCFETVPEMPYDTQHPDHGVAQNNDKESFSISSFTCRVLAGGMRIAGGERECQQQRRS